jgi:hypothetical protein
MVHKLVAFENLDFVSVFVTKPYFISVLQICHFLNGLTQPG